MTHSWVRRVVVVVLFCLLASASAPILARAATPVMTDGFVRVPTSSGQPWGDLTDFAFVPDSTGKLTRGFISLGRAKAAVKYTDPSGSIRTLATIPNVFTDGDFGLVGLSLSPDYLTTGEVALVATYDGTPYPVSRLDIMKVDNPLSPTTFTLRADRAGRHHPGRRPADGRTRTVAGTVLWAADGTLYAGFGDAASWTVADPAALRALDPDDPHGKIVHVDVNGRGRADEPLLRQGFGRLVARARLRVGLPEPVPVQRGPHPAEHALRRRRRLEHRREGGHRQARVRRWLAVLRRASTATAACGRAGTRTSTSARTTTGPTRSTCPPRRRSRRPSRRRRPTCGPTTGRARARRSWAGWSTRVTATRSSTAGRTSSPTSRRTARARSGRSRPTAPPSPGLRSPTGSPARSAVRCRCTRGRAATSTTATTSPATSCRSSTRRETGPRTSSPRRRRHRRPRRYASTPPPAPTPTGTP